MSQYSILIIEGDPAVSESLRAGLTREGFSVNSVSSGTEGIEHARKSPPHLILLKPALSVKVEGAPPGGAGNLSIALKDNIQFAAPEGSSVPAPEPKCKVFFYSTVQVNGSPLSAPLRLHREEASMFKAPVKEKAASSHSSCRLSRLCRGDTMRAKDRVIISCLLIFALGLAAQACRAPQSHIPTVTEAPAETRLPPLASPTAEATRTPLRAPTISVTASPPLASVTITAAKGNLFIRRGPGFSYDPVSVLMDGQSAQAAARDVLARWVQIPLPGKPEKTGWISVQSHYSVVDGEVMDLPALEPTDWPVMAYLRNCTFHQMQVDPGGIPLPGINYFPDNEIQLDPGTYTVHDTEVAGHPIVLTVQITEGSQIDIREDGSGEHRKCPVG